MAVFTVDRGGISSAYERPAGKRRVHKARVLGNGHVTGRCAPIWPDHSLIAFDNDLVTCQRCLVIIQKEILDRYVLMEVGGKPASETDKDPTNGHND